MLRHLKGVLLESTLQGGAVKGELAQAKLWVTTKPTKAAGASRRSRAEEAVCPKEFVSYLFRQRKGIHFNQQGKCKVM